MSVTTSAEWERSTCTCWPSSTRPKSDAKQYYSHWRGGYYLAAHAKSAPKNQIALLYFSHWDSPEAAQALLRCTATTPHSGIPIAPPRPVPRLRPTVSGDMTICMGLRAVGQSDHLHSTVATYWCLRDSATRWCNVPAGSSSSESCASPAFGGGWSMLGSSTPGIARASRKTSELRRVLRGFSDDHRCVSDVTNPCDISITMPRLQSC